LTSPPVPLFALSAGETGCGGLVADAMITCPKTHDVSAGLEDIRAFFEDDHVHMALVVAPDGRLVTTIERPDLPAGSQAPVPATQLGTLVGRTARPAQALDAAAGLLLRERRRRLAVVDDSGCLLGLLCLKKDRTGFCSDENVRERAEGGPRESAVGNGAATRAPAYRSRS
jgi:hypothetical protein